MMRSVLFATLFILVISTSASSEQLKFERAADRHVFYSGTIKVSGQFELRLDETSVQIMGKSVCFVPEGESKKLIPRDKDPRAPWFCFSNQDDAREMLGIPKQEGYSCGFTGTAEIAISDYVVDRTEGDVFDRAKLVTVIKQSRISQLPCN